MNIEREIVIATSTQRVWQSLTDVHDLTRWACDEAEVTEAAYFLRGNQVYGASLGGSVSVVAARSHMSFEWLLGGEPTQVTISLEAAEPDEFTLVRLKHLNVPDSVLADAADPKSFMDTMWAMFLRRLALWAERAEAGGAFNYGETLAPTIERHMVIDAELAVVWSYIVDPERRKTWFQEPLGEETARVERSSVTYGWPQDVPSTVTFRLEPMPGGKTLVIVKHVGMTVDFTADYHIGWQDYLTALAHFASRPIIRQTIFIEAQPSDVWHWFTTEEAMRAWWNENTHFEPRVGGRFEFADHGSDLHGLVTEMTPCSRFAFTFVEVGTEGERDPYVVTADLVPEAGGTRVYLTQSGFEQLPVDIRDRLFTGFRRGWADSPEIYRLARVVVGA